MYKLHCSNCDRVIEPNENFFRLTYVEFGVGNFAAAPRHSEVCASCFNDFKRATDWEIGKCEEVDMCKPPVLGTLPFVTQTTGDN